MNKTPILIYRRNPGTSRDLHNQRQRWTWTTKRIPQLLRIPNQRNLRLLQNWPSIQRQNLPVAFHWRLFSWGSQPDLGLPRRLHPKTHKSHTSQEKRQKPARPPQTRTMARLYWNRRNACFFKHVASEILKKVPSVLEIWKNQKENYSGIWAQ